MWGDAQGANDLSTEDPLAVLLLQITGPACIPLTDKRWQELLKQYNRLVHLDPQNNSLVKTACDAITRHSQSSSNLAILAIQVSMMLNDLRKTCERSAASASYTESSNGFGSNESGSLLTNNKHLAVIVGKARATCGALNLLRILSHATIVGFCESGAMENEMNSVHLSASSKTNSSQSPLNLAFTYSGTSTARSQKFRDGAEEILAALIPFISVANPIPELYDAMVLSLSLLLVLLSSQMYQPMVSSLQKDEILRDIKNRNESKGDACEGYIETTEIEDKTKLLTVKRGNGFLDALQKISNHQRKGAMSKIENNTNTNQNGTQTGTRLNNMNETDNNRDWAHSLTSAALNWIVKRPSPPKNSISFHHMSLLKYLVESNREEKPGADGMYENHRIVLARSPSRKSNKRSSQRNSIVSSDSFDSDDELLEKSGSTAQLIIDATRGVLRFSSTILMLPLRLVRLAASTIGLFGVGSEVNDFHSVQSIGKKDVIWITDSPIADIGCCILLLVNHNTRAKKGNREFLNSFRLSLSSLEDNRWGSGIESMEGIDIGNGDSDSDEYGKELDVVGEDSNSAVKIMDVLDTKNASVSLSVNFESLFLAFGKILHTEVGALLLYTFLQSSPMFAASISARSDLDTLVMPLLRTLYFSSTLHVKKATSKQSNLDSKMLLLPQSRPFRSQSQLYVIMILLLLFSQDASFGMDAFRRVTISSIPWYKERRLSDISLGSMLILALLRSIAFNLNRLRDGFLLSNCCAVLLNMGPHIVSIHSYTAMRLVSVTLSCMKSLVSMVQKDGAGSIDDPSTLIGMYAEVCRCLLQILKYCTRSEYVEQNLHLVYALVYSQGEFNEVISSSNSSTVFGSTEIEHISEIIKQANRIIQESGETLSAVDAMAILVNKSNELRVSPSAGFEEDVITSNVNYEDQDCAACSDFTFTYEEEADPEVFFVPYIWEVVSCVVTTSFIEWNKRHIRIYSMFDEYTVDEDSQEATPASNEYSQDVGDVV